MPFLIKKPGIHAYIDYLGESFSIIRKEAVILFYSLPVELGAYQCSKYNIEFMYSVL